MPAKKKKPDLAVLIGMAGKGPKKPEPEEEPDGDEGDESAHEDAMSELHAALKSDDMPRAVEAFKTLYDLCASDHDGDEKDY